MCMTQTWAQGVLRRLQERVEEQQNQLQKRAAAIEVLPTWADFKLEKLKNHFKRKSA